MKKIILYLLLIIFMIIPNVVLATQIQDTSMNLISIPVARIGQQEYSSLAEAVKSVPVDGTKTEIVLLTDVINGPGLVTVNGQNIVIDFNGYTYDASETTVGSDGTETNSCQFLKGSTVTLKNGTLTTTKAKIVIQNYSNLTLENMIIDGTQGTEVNYVVSINNGKVNIVGNTSIRASEGKIAFDCYFWPEAYKDGAQITIDTYGAIRGNIELASSTVGLQQTLLSTLSIKNMNHNGTFEFLDSRFEDNVEIEGGTYTTDVSKYLANGLICPNLYNEFVVVPDTQYNITVKEAEGGKVTVDKTKAQYGDTVNLTVTINDGYEFKSIEISDGNMGGILNEESFLMIYSGDVTIIPTFEKLKQTVEVPNEVTVDEKTESMLLGSLEEILKENKELATLVNNNNVEIEVILENAKIEDKEKETIEKTIEEKVKDIKVAKYLDISVNVKVILDEIPGGKVVEQLEQLKEKLTFSVEIPTDLPKVEEGYSRIYYIVRNHNGVIEILDTKVLEDEKTIEFSSDKFSTYAIAYIDEKIEEEKVENKVDNKDEKDETPKTGTLNITRYIIVVIVIILFVKVLINNKKVINNIKNN